MTREDELIQVVNSWHQNINIQEQKEEECESLVYTRNHFANMFKEKTGESLNISKRVENICYKRIQSGLSKKNKFSEKILNSYIDWCFDNIPLFVERYGVFNLSSCAKYAPEWDQNLNLIEIKRKYSIDDLHKTTVSNGIFDAFKQYGIPLSSTKLMIEKHHKESAVKQTILLKLRELTKNQVGLNTLRTMLMATVEHSPYESFVMFGNHTKTLEEFYSYFSHESWCPKL